MGVRTHSLLLFPSATSKTGRLGPALRGYGPADWRP